MTLGYYYLPVNILLNELSHHLLRKVLIDVNHSVREMIIVIYCSLMKPGLNENIEKEIVFAF